MNDQQLQITHIIENQFTAMHERMQESIKNCVSTIEDRLDSLSGRRIALTWAWRA